MNYIEIEKYHEKIKQMSDDEIEKEYNDRKNYSNTDERELFGIVESYRRRAHHKKELAKLEAEKETEMLKMAAEYNETVKFWKANGATTIGFYYTQYMLNGAVFFEWHNGEKFNSILPRMRIANEKFKEEISWQN